VCGKAVNELDCSSVTFRWKTSRSVSPIVVRVSNKRGSGDCHKGSAGLFFERRGSQNKDIGNEGA